MPVEGRRDDHPSTSKTDWEEIHGVPSEPSTPRLSQRQVLLFRFNSTNLLLNLKTMPIEPSRLGKPSSLRVVHP